ncbi:MAG: DNA polymerase IV [Firmicutes bacterium]|nr:DNA polymerase IV [Bacillota bacterium]
MNKRIIFHIDVNNAFLSWSAVKLLNEGYKKDIRTIPAVIAGSETERRGIVLAKSPVAKKYGIVTAETIYQAKKKCKDLEVYNPDYKWYYKKSYELMKYLSNFSPLLEQYSVDECFLDMTGMNYIYKDYIELAHKIKDEIKEKFGYTVNIGIGNNKLCAKMASDFEKPDKVHTLLEDEIAKKLWPLPVRDLFMVGRKTAEVLNSLNINTIYELAKTDEKKLKKYFKNQADYLKKASLGLDDSKVIPRSNTTTSISVSETLPYDFVDPDKLKEILFRQTEEVTRQLRYQKQYAKTVAVIYKNSSFNNYSAQEKLTNPTNSTKTIYKKVVEIFDKNYREDPIRLIGVRLSDFTNKNEHQLSLFENNEDSDESEIQKTIDDINTKFGAASVIPASLKIIGKSKSKRNLNNKN